VADITERKQTEEALKESEERSRAIVANSPIGIATSGSDKRFLSANDAFCRILGYTEVELRKLTFKDVTRPEDLKESLMKMEDLDSGKISSFTLEKRYVKKDGSTIFGKIMVSAIRDETGKPNLFIAELEDITERKKKEHELKEERNKLEAITQSIGAGFGIMSKDYHVLWVNKFIKEYKGDVEGKLCYATLNDLDHVCPDCGVKKVFENGVSYDAHEYKSVDIKGNPYWVELIATPIKDENGKVISAIEIAIDITEKKNLQSKLAEYSMNLEKLVGERTEELKQTQAKLVKSERLAAIGELAAMIGHDLRNPLAGMKNAVYYLNKHFSTGSNDTERKMFQVVDDCIDHSNKIINDLLEYSRNVKLEISETTPKELLRQAMLNLEIPKTIQVADLTLNEPAILVDVPKMVRVFVNLLKNAFDAMPDGGSMRIVSRTEPMEVEIEFSDTGMGMSQETLNRLWTPLFTTKAKGMGFGLAICKRFVEAHGGRIIVASQEGKGTTFIIEIPRKLCPTEA
jgi:PAS domain S-box-containing protein